MRRRAILGVLVLLLGVVGGFAILLSTPKGATMFSGQRPVRLGLEDGKLASCGRRLNCVSSQADAADAQRHVAPIVFRGTAAEAIAAARRAVESMPRAVVVRQDGNYLHAEFTSRWMGFVDDVEIAFDERAGLLHVRSASRVGRRDFGVNRKRVESLRARIEGRMGPP
jgi:uncharacterized protein (DUF1499 family)